LRGPPIIEVRATFNNRAAEKFTGEVPGKILMAMAATLQTRIMEKVNVANPRPYLTPSVDGEYLRKRTGWLQAHIVYWPTTADAVGKAGYVRIGYGKSAFYGAIWEVRKRRKGLLDALDEVRPQLMEMARKATG
jgi:hypothetical protein